MAMAIDGHNPGSTDFFNRLFASSVASGKGMAMAGLPPHLQVVKSATGAPRPSTRRQFFTGKASAKKRGKQ
jgi:hypothetical protein